MIRMRVREQKKTRRSLGCGIFKAGVYLPALNSASNGRPLRKRLTPRIVYEQA
jgi:hypothetical protein